MSVKCSPNEGLDETTKPSTNSLFRKFIDSTTLHGIGKVFEDGSKKRRLVWLLCLVTTAVTFLCSTFNLISSYTSFDVVTRVTIVNQDDAIFPAVTICNFNRLRKEYVKKISLSKFMTIANPFEANENNNTLSWSDSDKALMNISVEDVLKDGTHKMDYENMFLHCSFQGKDCYPKDFTPVFTRMGLCYTFNKDLNNPSFAKIQDPGDDFGLSLKLMTEQDQYYGSTVAGFKVHIHGQDEIPLVKENGFAVMPGTCTFVAVTRKTIKSLPAPYRTNCENKKLLGMSVYSRPLCYEACRASYIMGKCGCRDAEMPKFHNIRTCTVRDKAECVFSRQVEFTTRSLKNCSCPQPCHLTTYETRLSYAQYPSEHAKESLSPILAKHVLGNISDEEDVKNMYRYMGENAVQIKIYFENLNYNLIEDIPKYQLENLFAEAGGMFGLLLGASVLTVAEFFDFLISFIAMKFSNRTRPY